MNTKIKLYICQMKRYFILSDRKENELIEFNFLWYWKNKYTCVDARFVNIIHSRTTALYNFQEHLYKLWYLNNDMTEDDMVKEGLNLIKVVTNNNGTYLLDSDVYKISSEVFNNELPVDFISRVKSVKRIEWKQDLSGLMKLSVEEEYYLKIVEKEKLPLEIRKMSKDKKLNEVLKCINKIKMDKSKEKIIAAIKVLKETSETCTISDICKISGMSYAAVKKNYEEFMDENTVDGYKFVVNKNNTLKDDKMEDMKKAIKKIKSLDGKVSKLSVSKFSGVARGTVIKRWNELLMYI